MRAAAHGQGDGGRTGEEALHLSVVLRRGEPPGAGFEPRIRRIGARAAA